MFMGMEWVLGIRRIGVASSLPSSFVLVLLQPKHALSKHAPTTPAPNATGVVSPSSNYPRCPVRTVKAEEFIPGVLCAAANGLRRRGACPSVRGKSQRADVGSHAPSHSAPIPIVFLRRVGRRRGSRAAHQDLLPAPRQSGGRRGPRGE